MDYNTIAFADLNVFQYESCENFISKVVNDKLAVRKLFSAFWVAKTVLDAKRACEKLNELEELREVEEDDITSSEKSQKNEKNDESEENE